MKLIGLISYVLLLLGSLVSFITDIIRMRTRVYKPIFIAAIVSIMIFLGWILKDFNNTPQQVLNTPNQVSALGLQNTHLVYLTSEEISERLTSLLELHRLQPTHRDVSINIALLYSALGDTTRAQFYLTQATSLDPNNDQFTK